MPDPQRRVEVPRDLAGLRGRIYTAKCPRDDDAGRTCYSRRAPGNARHYAVGAFCVLHAARGVAVATGTPCPYCERPLVRRDGVVVGRVVRECSQADACDGFVVELPPDAVRVLMCPACVQVFTEPVDGGGEAG